MTLCGEQAPEEPFLMAGGCPERSGVVLRWRQGIPGPWHFALFLLLPPGSWQQVSLVTGLCQPPGQQPPHGGLVAPRSSHNRANTRMSGCSPRSDSLKPK